MHNISEVSAAGTIIKSGPHIGLILSDVLLPVGGTGIILSPIRNLIKKTI
jgi:hypothetical protein